MEVLLLETKLILKMLRTKYNITQEELAIKLGISNPSEIFFTNKVTNCITKLV